MKALILLLLLVIFTHTTYGQMPIPTEFENENSGADALPGIVMRTNGKTLETYVPDKHSDAAALALPGASAAVQPSGTDRVAAACRAAATISVRAFIRTTAANGSPAPSAMPRISST